MGRSPENRGRRATTCAYQVAAVTETVANSPGRCLSKGGMSMSDGLIFVIVVLARFLIPLGIPRFPLPSIIVAMILDAADQTIFQQSTDLNLDGYQSYDKALDIYYLAIAYISTLRNWTNVSGYAAARFLWYYRLVGVTAFELTQWRPLLLIFPNTFEYFFDWFEAVRTKWNPIRLTSRHISVRRPSSGSSSNCHRSTGSISRNWIQPT